MEQFERAVASAPILQVEVPTMPEGNVEKLIMLVGSLVPRGSFVLSSVFHNEGCAGSQLGMGHCTCETVDVELRYAR
jgi:hypothetical protein